MIWPHHFGDLAIIALVVMLGAFMLWQVKVNASAVRRAKGPYILLQEVKRQTDLAERQLAALERIATALEKRN
jgi:hypothetical protein